MILFTYGRMDFAMKGENVNKWKTMWIELKIQ